uniref:Uncharacterized protein n=2 Tax=Lepeophtheirus salmonis TaxID=72036 RepID=A0A0K2VAD3_LEPSM
MLKMCFSSTDWYSNEITNENLTSIYYKN